MDADLYCARCEYDLRTLGVAGVCPECATPIAESVAAAANPLHAVRRPLRVAAGVLLAAVALRVTAAVLLAIFHVGNGVSYTAAGYAMSVVLNPWPFPQVLSLVANFGRHGFAIDILSAGMTLSFAALCAGVWLITRPRIRVIGWVAFRRTTRWAVVVIVTIGAMLLWRPTNNLLGFLEHAPTVAASVIGPPLLIAVWTGRVWWRTFRLAGRPRFALLPCLMVVVTGMASLINHVRLDVNPWVDAAISALALLLLAWMWLDLWQLLARRATPAPAATMP